MEAWALLAMWVGAASLVAFTLCVVDKRRARRQRARVPERVLLGVALVGGTPGLLVGMAVARHKTRKVPFLLQLAIVVLVQAAVAWLVARAV